GVTGDVSGDRLVVRLGGPGERDCRYQTERHTDHRREQLGKSLEPGSTRQSALLSGCVEEGWIAAAWPRVPGHRVAGVSTSDLNGVGFPRDARIARCCCLWQMAVSNSGVDRQSRRWRRVD